MAYMGDVTGFDMLGGSDFVCGHNWEEGGCKVMEQMENVRAEEEAQTIHRRI